MHGPDYYDCIFVYSRLYIGLACIIILRQSVEYSLIKYTPDHIPWFHLPLEVSLYGYWNNRLVNTKDIDFPCFGLPLEIS